MKQQLKLNESELYNIIEGAVKNLVMEYLPYEGGKVAARRLQQGDASAFEKYMDYGLNNGWTNDDMSDFQSGIETGPSVVEDEDFEDLNDGPVNTAVDGVIDDDIAFESKRAVKVNESQLFDIIKESVKKILKEGEMPSDEEGIRRSFDKQNYIFNSKVCKTLKKIYNAGMELKCEYIMDLCIEAQTELLKEKGFM